MKNIILTLLSLTPFLKSYAQLEIGGGLLSNKLNGINKNIDVLYAGGGLGYLSYNIQISKRVYVNPFIVGQSIKYIMDGAFTKNSGTKTSFGQTSFNVVQNSLSIYSLKLPVLLYYNLSSDIEKNSSLWLGLGPFIQYDVYSNQEYKINNVKYSDNNPYNNLIHSGLQFDFCYLPAVKNVPLNLALHIGTYYQITDYVQNSSFNPFGFYMKLGYRVNNIRK